ncbi:MAG: coproporphyrinogen III oxidase [Alphaproteobacteria bacterium]|nr:coproporphyrinogen III oxidase [Alphaproteobacteria bacterium]
MAPVVAEADGFGVYVHWPFCQSKCPYCDFNSHVRERIDQRRWRAALLAEIDHAAAAEAPGMRATSLFFGGGTPSLMAPETVAAVIERVRAHFATDGALEITLEANPTSVEAARLKAFRDAGVNRVSIGVQALDDASLRFLGREHGAAEAMAAVATARALFANVSLDLIYARPGQTVAAWEAELTSALRLGTDHLSAYQLTIERGTRFHTLHARGQIALPDADTAAALFEATDSVLGAAGLAAYEVSNHARPGLACRHNLTYWRSEPYVGVGPGAHGRTPGGSRQATVRRRAPEAWLAAVEGCGHGTESVVPVAPEETVVEALMMGLRLAEGIDAARFQRLTGRTLAEAVAPGSLARLVAGGFLVADASGLRATPAGRRVLNAVLAELVP